MLLSTMNEFKTILTKLKEIITEQLQTNKKVLDKDIANELNIKPSTLASHKRRDKPPYKAILNYCHNNCIDVPKVLFSKDEPIISYPAPEPVEDGEVRVRYFRSIAVYKRYLSQYKKV